MAGAQAQLLVGASLGLAAMLCTAQSTRSIDALPTSWEAQQLGFQARPPPSPPLPQHA